MSYFKLYYHLVFRTYRSQRTIAENHEQELYRYILGYCRQHHICLIRINSLPDHIHMFVSTGPNICPADLIRELKKSAGNYIREHRNFFPMFNGWGKGYCAISYSEAEKDKIVSYIRNQKEHHKKVSFTDELRQIMRDAHIEYHEEYFRKDWEE